MHALAKRCLDLCRAAVDGGADVLVLDDTAVNAIADAWAALADPFEGADAVMSAALVLLEKPAGKPAGKTLLALVLAVQPALQQRDQKRLFGFGFDGVGAARPSRGRPSSCRRRRRP